MAEKSARSDIGQPIRNGFGMELLTRLLPYDLDATTSVDFQESELRFQLELPAEHVMNTAGK